MDYWDSFTYKDTTLNVILYFYQRITNELAIILQVSKQKNIFRSFVAIQLYIAVCLTF